MQERTATTTSETKTQKRKWLSRIGTFLMMGGWMLVVVLGFAIAVLISTALNGH